jgi:cob(I)alamin adenosyltransferase
MLAARPHAATFRFSAVLDMTASMAATAKHQPRAGATPWRPAPLARAASSARSLRLVAQQEGLLQVHTAPFRGSFSGVFSQALRSAGLGSRVLISQFLKGGVDQGLERSVWLCGRLQWLRPAVAACLAEPAEAAVVSPEDRAAVLEVWDYTRGQLLAGELDQLVLDELGLAVDLGYLPAGEVIEVLNRRPAHLDVILTGPCMPPALLAMADQVTQLRRGF